MLAKNIQLAAIAALFVLGNLVVGHSAVLAQLDLPNLGGGAALGDDAEKVVATAYFTAPSGDKPAMLHVTADIAPGWHIYSTTQAAGGPVKSRIKLTASPAFKLLGEFKPSKAAEIHEYKDVWPDLKVEEHEGSITWSAPIEFAPGTDLTKLQIPGSIYAMACSKECVPPTDYKFVAKGKDIPQSAAIVTGAAKPGDSPANVAEYRHPLSHLSLRGELTTATVRPGESTTIEITARPEKEWHVYALAAKDPKIVSKPTLINFEQSAVVAFGSPKPSAAPIEEQSAVDPGTVDRFYEQPVTWEIPVKVAADAKPGVYPIQGLIGFQTCKSGPSGQCDLPRAAKIGGNLTVAPDASNAKSAPLSFSDAKYGEAAAAVEKATGAPKTSSSATPTDRTSASETPVGFDASAISKNVKNDVSFVDLVLGAFFGGMLLNLMPCVFPVIGLKILSFVEQSHHSRAKLLSLNAWYSVGVLIVFLGLATVAILLRTWLNIDFKYGSQNSVPAIAIGMATLMFAMGLSLLGVWEIPIPGFLGSGKAAELTSHEGVSGALAKGVITTLLGASCSGPLVAVPFGFALDSGTPVWAVYGTFFVIGLGMSFPYLILGANPSLLRFLPRPGAWMDTFKHICGFVLFGAMVWVLTWLKPYYVAPTVAFLIGLWAACWWVGRVPITVPFAKRMQAWGWAIAFTAVVGLFAFDWLAPYMQEKFDQAVASEIGKLNREIAEVGQNQPELPVAANVEGSTLPWQPFSTELLTQLTRQQKTVMVDFTADWCVNCKALEKAVLNTAAVKEVVLQNNIVPLVADYTESPPELTHMLSLLKAGAVPVMAIFPAKDPNNPIIFRGGYTQQILIDALQKAGPSQGAPERRTASAM